MSLIGVSSAMKVTSLSSVTSCVERWTELSLSKQDFLILCLVHCDCGLFLCCLTVTIGLIWLGIDGVAITGELWLTVEQVDVFFTGLRCFLREVYSTFHLWVLC